MGHDILPIGNHKLNTDSLQELAEDIVSRVDIGIEYGYFGYKAYFGLLGINKGDEDVIVGKLNSNCQGRTFRLIDSNYQLKELYAKFGDELFYQPEYWDSGNNQIPEEVDIVEERKKLQYPSYFMDFFGGEDYQELDIHKDTFTISLPYYTRWSGFCNFFMEKDSLDSEYFTAFNAFRATLMNYSVKFGGDKMYYLNDQCSVLEGAGEACTWGMSWDDFCNLVRDKSAGLMVDIPLFIKNEQYRRKFQLLNQYPISFVDNFDDLRQKKA